MTLSDKIYPKKLIANDKACFIEDIKQAIKELKEELDWIKIKDDTGCWSPGQVKMEIERIFGKELVE